jgi:hypothetical protein
MAAVKLMQRLRLVVVVDSHAAAVVVVDKLTAVVVVADRAAVAADANRRRQLE